MSDFADKLIDDETLKRLRELACRKTGMTMAELLEAEANVCHPKEVIAIQPTPEVLAMWNMKRAGVPDRHLNNVGSKRPIECQALRAVRTWMQTTEAFLVLQGGVGTRKTGSASWTLGQSAGRFLEAPGLIGAYLDKTEAGKRETWDAILRSPLVVLDDLGTERRDAQGIWLEAFTELWNTTYNRSKRLIVTTNTVTPAAFKAETSEGGYGPRSYSRLTESGRWIAVSGEDMRPHMRYPGEDDDDDAY